MAVLVPGLREVFQTYGLTGTHWVVLIALSAVIVPIFEGIKLLQRAGLVGKNLGPMSRRA